MSALPPVTDVGRHVQVSIMRTCPSPTMLCSGRELNRQGSFAARINANAVGGGDPQHRKRDSAVKGWKAFSLKKKAPARLISPGFLTEKARYWSQHRKPTNVSVALAGRSITAM